MVALVIILALVVVLLGVLVAGLLRSHADILKALHDLGAGVGDPAGEHLHQGTADRSPTGATSGPLTIGPQLPAERDSSSAPDVAGVTPEGDARAIPVGDGDRFTLLAFLSSGCSTCANFWTAFAAPERLGLPDGVRLVVVTKGPELEIAAEVRGRARVPVVMSTEAWGDYEVPGSPFFVLVDGRSGRRIGEGVASHFPQVADLVRRAQVDAGYPRSTPSTPGQLDNPPGQLDNPPGQLDTPPGQLDNPPGGLDGPARERANDLVLRNAGILPGDPSLYPRSLDDVFEPGAERP
ncbi:MAG: hypothetical protein ACLP2J_04600 [Acidimicrobiales bacterium]